MHFSTSTIALFAALYPNLLVSASPVALPETPGLAGPAKCYSWEYLDVTYKDVDSDPRVVDGSDITGCEHDCTLGHSNDWSVSVEVSVGLNLGLDYKGAAGGLGASVAYSTTKGQSYSTSIGCPDGARCMLVATNHMVRVKGTRHGKGPDTICTKKRDPYDILLPKTVKNSDGSQSAMVSYKGCFVKRPPPGTTGFTDYIDCPI